MIFKTESVLVWMRFYAGLTLKRIVKKIIIIELSKNLDSGKYIVMEEKKQLQEEMNKQKTEELNIENQIQKQTEVQETVTTEQIVEENQSENDSGQSDKNQTEQDSDQADEKQLQQEETKGLPEQGEDSDEEKNENQGIEEQEVSDEKQNQSEEVKNQQDIQQDSEKTEDEKTEAPQEEIQKEKIQSEELPDEAKSQEVQSEEQILEENEKDKEKKEKRKKKKQPLFYEDFLLKNNWKQKRYRKLLWGGVEIDDVVQKLLSYIPENFHGRLLDVPAGTGVFTHEKYAQLKDAKIVCLEPREKEAEQLKEVLEQDENCSHVKVIDGKMERLPFRRERFDVVLCMNGFQAFQNKSRAFSEVTRVLRKRGRLIGCFYVKGQSKKADWFVKHVYAKKGWFAPPYDTLSSLRLKLAADYRIKSFHVRGSMVYFCAVKKDLEIVHARENHFVD